MTTTIEKRQNGNSSARFGNVVDNIFENSLRHFFDDNFWSPAGTLATGTVPVNVRETEQRYEIDVIAPGCRREDFSINIDNNNTLSISFTHKDERKDEDEKGWVRNEYVQRSFNRTFTLDDTVDANKVSAAYRDGILHLVLSKNEKAQKTVKKIDIK